METNSFLDEFDKMVGETICDCQSIEHDIKLIYAAMIAGDFDKNYDSILEDKLTLGETITLLEELDNKDGNPYFDKEEYKLLKNIASKRNRIVHESYINFSYIDDEEETDKAFTKEYNFVQKFHDEVSHLWEEVQRVRGEVMEDFGRL